MALDELVGKTALITLNRPSSLNAVNADLSTAVGSSLDRAAADFLGQLLPVCLPKNGQTCHASTRVLAPRSRHAEVVTAITATVAGHFSAIGSGLGGGGDVTPQR